MSVMLSEHLPLLASAPDGIQELRGLILSLAMIGKLTEADTRNWAPLTFADLGEWGSGGTPLKAHTDFYGGDIPWLVIGDLNDGVVSSAETHITQKGLENSSAKLVPPGTLLIAMYGSIGKLGIAGIECATNQAIAHCRVNLAKVECRFLFYFVRAIRGSLQASGQGLAQQNISQKILKAIPIRLPPLAEQHRIVAKVDELMALCDRLEAEQADAEAAHTRLAEALLGTLTQSTDAADLAANWQRLAEHFDTLFTTESSLDALKQTILQLAVMGKLVPQDPNDEPASELLMRIRKSRNFRRKASEVNFGEIELDQPNLPDSWIWTVVDQVADDDENSITDGPFGANLKTEHYVDVPGYRVIRLQNIGQMQFRGKHQAYITEQRFTALSKHQVFAGDLVVAGLVDEEQGIRCCLLPEDIGPAVVKADCYRFSVHNQVSVSFALIFLNAPLSSSFATAHHHGMTLTRIGLGNFRKLPFPLPPLTEQHRIVAKVDELMALCDRLKADLAESRTRQARLSATLIESALEAA